VHKTFGRVTSATRTNERVALVDFYAEYVLRAQLFMIMDGPTNEMHNLAGQLVRTLQGALADPREARGYQDGLRSSN
jgi:hypothetical protein